MLQISVFVFITFIIGFFTWKKCRQLPSDTSNEGREYFLAGGSLSWVFVAGSITLTNLSTDQLVGMNGNQMLLLAWWEIAAVVGLIILAFVFLPLYYRHKCTTTTELLERKLSSPVPRIIVSLLFLLAGLFIYLPVVLYSGSLFLQTTFALDIPLVVIALGLASLGAAYAVFGGLKAVAVSDTYSGVALLALACLVVYLAAKAIDFDFSGIPRERLTLIGDSNSPIPWHTLLTGMIFIQIYYWSFNQVITQRAMASKSLAEAQKGVVTAAVIRLLIVPAIVVVPGVVAYQLYGDVDDAAYGMLIGDLLPTWLSGAFAAVIVAAVLTTFNSALNSAAALCVCDLMPHVISGEIKTKQLARRVSILFTVFAVALVPVYSEAESIINLVQELNGILSMPILSAFILSIFFKNMSAKAVCIAIVAGSVGYGTVTYVGFPIHYIHLMGINLIVCVVIGVLANNLLTGKKAVLTFEEMSFFRRKSGAATD
ncbi:SLC5 family protein [Porticoccus sp. GXU_MW_L64]